MSSKTQRCELSGDGWALLKVSPFSRPLRITLRASKNPSESPDRVRTAVANLAPGLSLSWSNEGTELVGETQDERTLHVIYRQLRARRTMGVARRLLRENASGNETRLLFNKQPAYAGIAAICEEEAESPLGPITLTVATEHLNEFIDWLAPG